MDIKKRNNFILIFVALAIFLLTLIDYVSIKKVSDSRIMMDTAVKITVYGMGRDKDKLDGAIEAGFNEIARVAAIMSRYEPDSIITRINNSSSNKIYATKGSGTSDRLVEPYGVFTRVDEEAVSLLEMSKQVGELTNGAFDITLGNVVDLWDFTGDAPKVPDENAIKELLAHTGNDKVEISYSDGTDAYYARLTDPKAKLDLGGIAKGYAIMQAATVLRANGVTSGIIDAGGDIVVIGDKKGSPFRIGIKSPDGGGMIGIVNARDTSIVTSGDYERYFEVGGVRYHHILDPATGYPARLSRSVTVITRDATIADALCTALFVMGADEGIALVEKLDGIETVIIDAAGEIRVSSGAVDLLELQQ